MSSTSFICTLPERIQGRIRNEIVSFLETEGYKMKDIKTIVEDAINGRLCHLEENIDIQKYIKEAET